MSKVKQPDGSVHRMTPGATWPIVNPGATRELSVDSSTVESAMNTVPADDAASDEAVVWDGTEHDARYLRRARMLPPKGPLTDQQIDDVRVSVRRFHNDTKTPLSQLAREIKMDSSTVSMFLSGSYKGDNSGIARALNSAIERLARAEEAKLPNDWFPFRQAELMLRVVNAAVASRKMGLCTAPSGACKTSTVLAAQMLHPGSLVIRCNTTMKSSGRVLRAVATALGTTRSKASDLVLEEIVQTLRKTTAPILFDESQRLGDSALEAVRDIHDMAEVPVIFFGTDDLALNIDNRGKWLGQFRRRMTHRHHVGANLPGSHLQDGPDGGGVRSGKPKPMFTAEELVRWMQKMGVRLTDDGLQAIFELANIPEMGCLGMVVECVRRCRTHKDYKEKSTPLDAAIIRSIARKIHGITFDTSYTLNVEKLQLARAAVA